MQGTRVRALVWKDPTCRRAARPVTHDDWACASGACAPQWERPRQWEARAPRWRVAPTRQNWRKPSHRNKDPTHPPKKNMYIYIVIYLYIYICKAFIHWLFINILSSYVRLRIQRRKYAFPTLSVFLISETEFHEKNYNKV